jgi:hypothetical protein
MLQQQQQCRTFMSSTSWYSSTSGRSGIARMPESAAARASACRTLHAKLLLAFMLPSLDRLRLLSCCWLLLMLAMLLSTAGAMPSSDDRCCCCGAGLLLPLLSAAAAVG